MTEQQLELRERQRERQEASVARGMPRVESSVPKCKILMRNGVWQVPLSERPVIHIPNDPPAQVTERAPDHRRNLLVAQSGSKVVRA